MKPQAQWCETHHRKDWCFQKLGPIPFNPYTRAAELGGQTRGGCSWDLGFFDSVENAEQFNKELLAHGYETNGVADCRPSGCVRINFRS